MSARSDESDVLPSVDALGDLFLQKYGQIETVGWAPRRRFRFRYFSPADVYEAFVMKQVASGCAWLDVGGGCALFPENPGLARTLAARCSKVVAVDPSYNVQRNAFVSERVQSSLEEYDPGFQFDLATLRMVVEHIRCPEPFVAALSRLVRPGGAIVVFTVNRWSPITLLSQLLPFWLHHPIKQCFWGGEKEDTFPVHYRMNTRRALQRVFAQAGFEERAFAKLDDLSAFGKFKWLNYLELLLWRCLRKLNLPYPENCLLGLYIRREDRV